MTWKSGESGNASGRPAGRSTRRELGEAFLRVVKARSQREGASCLDKMIQDQPSELVKLVARILQQELKAEINPSASFLDVLAEANRLAKSESVAVEDLHQKGGIEAIRR